MICVAAIPMTHQNYANQFLQDGSFQGLDLTGADFSHADVRGCNFTGATLVGANLTGVKMGQSQRQRNRLIVVAVFAPAAIVGLIFLLIKISLLLFGDRFDQGFNVLMGGLPFVLLILEVLFRDGIERRFPQTTNLMGIAGVSALFQIMGIFTIFLAIIGLSNLSDGARGLFLLGLTVVSLLITRRVFRWLKEAIVSSCGTCFRKANLTDANLSQAHVQNTDFCFATLTGACIFKWLVQRDTQFNNVYCEYLYLEPALQHRYPPEGKMLQGEAVTYLAGYRRNQPDSSPPKS